MHKLFCKKISKTMLLCKKSELSGSHFLRKEKKETGGEPEEETVNWEKVGK